MVSSIQLKGVDNLATNKNITMKQFNGTDYDTLYPKTIASQIPDVYSKTDTITAETLSRLGLGADKLPNDAFQQIKTLIDNVQTSTNSKAKIQTGSYVGTGTYGENNPCSLTFDFEPKFLMVQSSNTRVAWFMGAVGAYPSDTYLNPPYSHDSEAKLYIKRSGKTVYWYNSTGPNEQLNYLNANYYYVAIY